MSQHVAELFNCVRKKTCTKKPCATVFWAFSGDGALAPELPRAKGSQKLRENFYFLIFFRGSRISRKTRVSTQVETLFLRRLRLPQLVKKSKNLSNLRQQLAQLGKKSEKLEKKFRVAADFSKKK